MAVQRAGEVLRASVIAELEGEGLAPDARDSALLDQAVTLCDRVAELRAVVAAEGATYTDKGGLLRPSPLLAEIRQTTMVMARCLSLCPSGVPWLPLMEDFVP